MYHVLHPLGLLTGAGTSVDPGPANSDMEAYIAANVNPGDIILLKFDDFPVDFNPRFRDLDHVVVRPYEGFKPTYYIDPAISSGPNDTGIEYKDCTYCKFLDIGLRDWDGRGHYEDESQEGRSHHNEFYVRASNILSSAFKSVGDYTKLRFYFTDFVMENEHLVRDLDPLDGRHQVGIKLEGERPYIFDSFAKGGWGEGISAGNGIAENVVMVDQAHSAFYGFSRQGIIRNCRVENLNRDYWRRKWVDGEMVYIPESSINLSWETGGKDPKMPSSQSREDHPFGIEVQVIGNTLIGARGIRVYHYADNIAPEHTYRVWIDNNTILRPFERPLIIDDVPATTLEGVPISPRPKYWLRGNLIDEPEDRGCLISSYEGCTITGNYWVEPFPWGSYPPAGYGEDYQISSDELERLVAQNSN